MVDIPFPPPKNYDFELINHNIHTISKSLDVHFARTFRLMVHFCTFSKKNSIISIVISGITSPLPIYFKGYFLFIFFVQWYISVYFLKKINNQYSNFQNNLLFSNIFQWIFFILIFKLALTNIREILALTNSYNFS